MGCNGSKAAAKPSTTEAVAPAPAPAKEAQAVTLEADAVPQTADIVDAVEAQVGIGEHDLYIIMVKRDLHNLLL